MTLDEILQCFGTQAETFIKPQAKAEFKKTIDPYFEEVSAFKKKLDPYILRLKKEIDKYYKKLTQSKLLDMYNRPGEDYIKCSNHVPAVVTPYFDIYYPEAEYGHIWGWIPQKAYENEPLGRLLSYANWGESEEQPLTMFQFATVAILHDVPRIKNRCNLIYLGSGDDLADRAALRFLEVLEGDENRKIKTPFARGQIKRVIDRLKNAFDTVKIKLDAINLAESRRQAAQNKSDDPTGPLITLAVVVQDYQISRAQIKRDITDGKLKSHRKKLRGKHIVSRKDVNDIYLKR